MSGRDHAASTIRDKSIQSRRRVMRDFVGLLMSISIACYVFAPPTTVEQELSALVFGVH